MKRFVTWAILICFIPLSAWPSSVVKLKGDRILIALDGEQPIAVGQTYFTVDTGGKKRSLVKIVAVKDNRAVAQILKGKSAEGHVIVAASQNGQQKAAMAAAEDEGRISSKDLSRYGIVISYLMNNMSAVYNSGASTTNMKGFGVGALGYHDFEMSDRSDIRISVGLEQFQVAEEKTDLSCAGGTSNTCNALITYLSSYGLYKFILSDKATKFWIGGGGGFLLALSKSSTVLNSAQITTNYVYTVSGGVDFAMKQGQYLPVILEYSMFPSANSINANYIAVRVGWGWR